MNRDGGTVMVGHFRTDLGWKPMGGQDMSGMCDSGLGCTHDTFRPASPQPAGRKRRVGDRLASGPGIGMPASNEGALWGTPRKCALFGSDRQNSISSGSDVPEGRSGWPPEGEYLEVAQSRRSPQDNYLEGTWSPSVKLVAAVLRLQKDMEEFRAESGYGSAGSQATQVQTSGRSRFTSTPVPRYAGRSSWDQYRLGDALNAALLVPKSQRVLPGVLVRALSEHYGSPGRLAQYRRQFESSGVREMICRFSRSG